MYCPDTKLDISLKNASHDPVSKNYEFQRFNFMVASCTQANTLLGKSTSGCVDENAQAADYQNTIK